MADKETAGGRERESELEADRETDRWTKIEQREDACASLSSLSHSTTKPACTASLAQRYCIGLFTCLSGRIELADSDGEDRT